MTQLETTPSLPAIRADKLTPEQTRFNTLIGQIEQARKLIADWQHQIALYRSAYLKVQVPLQEELRVLQRQWILAVDALIEARRWTRAERETWVDMLCESIGDYLGRNEDAALKAIFSRRAEVDFDAERERQLKSIKAMAERMSGLDLGPDDATSESELYRRMNEARAAAHRAQAEAHATEAQSRRKSAAQKKREAADAQASLSVREIYRKLASALHPDRETDPAQRAEKTALMQQANRAYAANDLLALLELQLRIEQVDAAHVAGADGPRLKHYNKVLAEQLGRLRSEAGQIALGFTMEFGLDPAWKPNAKRLNAALSEQSRRLRQIIDRTVLEMRMFEHEPAATKRWLKGQRERILEEQYEEDPFS